MGASSARRATRLTYEALRRAGTIAAAFCLVTMGGCGAVLDPAGPMADANLALLRASMLVMLAIVVPTIALALGTAWWFREGNSRARRRPEFVYSGRIELVVWSIPLMTILFLGGMAWLGSFRLDPYRPIDAKDLPLEVQVVSLDWKWLFIYPEQRIASVNRLVLPVGRAVRFRITSASVLNTFFVPRLGGMIYAMNGMTTQLNLRADRVGTFRGISGHYSGEGFSKMGFAVDAVPQAAFINWAAGAYGRGPALDAESYRALAKPTSVPIPFSYGSIDPGLFDTVVKQIAPPAPGPGPAIHGVQHGIGA